jgi:hypothetical protein
VVDNRYNGRFGHRDDRLLSHHDGHVNVLLTCHALGRVHPLAVAVDEQAGRAFVLNYGGTVREPEAWWVPWVSRARRWLPRLPQPASSTRIEPGRVSVLDLSRL